MMNYKTDFKSEHVNRAYILTTCGRKNGNCHSPFSILLSPFSDLGEGVTTPIEPWASLKREEPEADVIGV
jgi:hypothetical protein